MFMKYLEMNLSDESEAPLINFWHQVSTLTFTFTLIFINLIVERPVDFAKGEAFVIDSQLQLVQSSLSFI